MLQGELENGSWQPRDLFKNRHGYSWKISKLTLSEGMSMKGDDDDDEIDAEVRHRILHRQH
jgi:hypothetical protein